MNVKTLINIAILSSFSFLCQGQEGWSLDSCLSYALSHNLTIKAGETAVEEAIIGRKKAAGELLPTFGINANENFAKDFSDRIHPSVEASFSIQSGMSGYFRYRSAESFANAETNRQKWNLKELEIAVTEAFLQAIVYNSELDFARENVRARLKELEFMRYKVAAGARKAADLAEMEACLANERSTVVKVKYSLEQSLFELQGLMNKPFDAEFKIIADYENGSADTSGIVGYERLLTESEMEGNPRIMGARDELKGAEMSLKSTIGDIFPSISISGDYEISKDSSPSLSIGVFLPIFSGFQRKAAIKQSRLAVEKAAINLDMIRTETEREIRERLICAKNCFSLYEMSRYEFLAQQKSLEFIKAEFEAGAITVLDYTLAIKNFNQARSEMLNARYKYIFQIRVLEIYLNDE